MQKETDTLFGKFTAKLIFCDSSQIDEILRPQGFHYDNFEISIKSESNEVALITISAIAGAPKDNFHAVFSLLLQLFQLSFGYFPQVTERTFFRKGEVNTLNKPMVQKFCSATEYRRKLYQLIDFSEVDFPAALTKLENLKNNTNESLDVYYVAISESDLYLEIKLTLVIQACEGLGKPTMKNIHAFPLKKSQSKQIKKIANDVLKNSDELGIYCKLEGILIDDLLEELKRSMSHFHDVTLRHVLENYFKKNIYAISLNELGSSLKTPDDKGINFIQRSLNHRNYFAHLTDKKVKFEGGLANGALEIYSMLLRVWIIEELSLANLINDGYFNNWKKSFIDFASRQVNSLPHSEKTI